MTDYTKSDDLMSPSSSSLDHTINFSYSHSSKKQPLPQRQQQSLVNGITNIHHNKKSSTTSSSSVVEEFDSLINSSEDDVLQQQGRVEQILQDETSAWSDVASICHSILSSSSKKNKKWMITSLSTCAKYHMDTRCRILTCRTLASSLSEKAVVEEVEEEIKNDVLQTLFHVALEDSSDIVCSIALQCCHSLLYTTTSISSRREDIPGPYSPFPSSSQPPSILEWQERQHSFVIVPKLQRLLSRISHFTSHRTILSTLQFCTSCALKLLLQKNSCSTTKQVHAKHGGITTKSFVQTYQTQILYPLLDHSELKYKVLHHILQFPNPNITILRNNIPYLLQQIKSKQQPHDFQSTLLLLQSYLPMQERIPLLNIMASSLQQPSSSSLDVYPCQSKITAALHHFQKSIMIYPCQMKAITQIVTFLFLPTPSISILQQFKFPSPSDNNNLEWIMAFCTVCLEIGNLTNTIKSSNWQQCALEILTQLSSHLLPSSNDNNNNSMMKHQPYLQLLYVLLKSMGYPCYFSHFMIIQVSQQHNFPTIVFTNNDHQGKKKLSTLLWTHLMEQILPKIINSSSAFLFITTLTDYWIHECMSTIHDHFIKNANEEQNTGSSLEGPIDTDTISLPNFYEDHVRTILSYLTNHIQQNNLNRSFLAIAQIESIGRISLEWYHEVDSSSSSSSVHDIYKLCHTLLQGQGNIITTTTSTDDDEKKTLLTSDILLNKQCLEAANRLKHHSSLSTSTTSSLNITNLTNYYSPLLDSPFLQQPLVNNDSTKKNEPQSPSVFSSSKFLEEETSLLLHPKLENTKQYFFSSISLQPKNNKNSKRINHQGRSRTTTKNGYNSFSLDNELSSNNNINEKLDEDSHNFATDWLFTCPTLFTNDDYKFAYLYQLRRQVLLLYLEKAFLQCPLRSLLLNDAIETQQQQTPTPVEDDDENSHDDDHDDDTYSLPSRHLHHSHSNKVLANSILNLSFNTWPTICQDRTQNQFLLGQEQHQGENNLLDHSIMSPSDPVQVLLTYGTHQHCVNGQCEIKLGVKIQLFNITAVPIPKGLRLDLSINKDNQQDFMEENSSNIFVIPNEPLAHQQSSSSLPNKKMYVYKESIEPGEQLIWEETFSNWPLGHYSLCLTVTFRDLQNETNTYQHILINPTLSNNNESTMPAATKTTITAQDDWNHTNRIQEDDTVDITLVGDSVRVSPILMLHPCPLVFYRDCCGDEVPFQFLWTSMIHRLPPILLSKKSLTQKHDESKTYFLLTTHISKLTVTAMDRHNDAAFTAWAFQSWYGHRLFCILSQRIENSYSLMVRSDNVELLNAIFGNMAYRTNFITNLMGGQHSWDAQPFRSKITPQDSLSSLYSL